MDVVYCTLVAYRQMDVNAVVCQLDLIVVGSHMLVVPVGTDYVAHAQSERTSLPMVSHHHGQSVQIFRGVVTTSGIYAHKAVGQLYSGECRHKQMAYIAYVGIYVVYWFALGGMDACCHTEGECQGCNVAE